MRLVRGALTVLLILAAIGDVRTGRISNRLILLGLGIGFCYRIYSEGFLGIFTFCIHAGAPVVLLFLLFLMRVLGAGDIKLFSIISSICSFREMFVCMAAAFVVGAVWAVLRMLRLRNLDARIIGFCVYVRTLFTERSFFPYPLGAKEKENTVPFSTTILLGYVIGLGVCV